MNEKECDKRIFQNRFISITLGETQEEISRKINTTRQNVGKLLSGQTLPNALLLKSICKAYGVSADYLLGITDKQNIDIDVRGCSEITGLSEEAIKNIKEHSTKDVEDPLCDYTTVCNMLIESPLFFELLELLDIIYLTSSEMFYNYDTPEKREILSPAQNDRVDIFRYKAQQVFEKIISVFDFRIQYPEEFKKIKKYMYEENQNSELLQFPQHFQEYISSCVNDLNLLKSIQKETKYTIRFCSNKNPPSSEPTEPDGTKK